MIERDIFMEQQSFQDIERHPNEPLSTRVVILIWLSLCTLGWAGIAGVGVLLFS